MLIFALPESRDFGEQIANELGVGLAELEERSFPDGEFQSRAIDCPRGEDVFVVQSLHEGPNVSVCDKALRLLILLEALRDSGASRLTAIIPYLAFARQDRRLRPHEPLALRTLAQLLETAGVSAVITVDVHNLAAFQNAFRSRTIHLEAREEFARKAVEIGLGDRIVIASPDLGGADRARRLGEALSRSTGVPFNLAFLEKHRVDGKLVGMHFAGEVRDAHVLIVDDMISTGSTLVRAVDACRQRGARRISAFATHGLFSGEAGKALERSGLEKIVVSDTVPPFRLAGSALMDKLDVVSVAPLFANAIRNMHENG